MAVNLPDKREMKRMLLGNIPNIDIRQVVRDAVKVHSEEIIKLNQEQLKRGLKYTRSSLGRYKNLKYKNRLTPVDLKLKGKFYEKFYLKATLEKYEINAYKYPVGRWDLVFLLKRKYGNTIFGLLPEYKEYTGKLILPNMKKDYKNRLGI